MITYPDFGLHNRIGNYLFQYAGLLGMVAKYDESLVLPSYYLWDYLQTKPIVTENSPKEDVLFHFRGDWFDPQYVDEFFKENNGKIIRVNLNPYLQSERWWEHCFDYVKEMLRFKEEGVDKVKNQYKDFFDKPTIGIGIRLGTDYSRSRDFFQLPHEWYTNALEDNFEGWRENYNVVVFSDNVELAKVIFEKYPFMYAEHNKTHILKYDKEHFHNGEAAMNHLILGSLMDNFIVPMSTFSVWQALLCEYRPRTTEAKIVCSNRNFAGSYLKQMKNLLIDYYPPRWIRYEKRLDAAR